MSATPLTGDAVTATPSGRLVHAHSCIMERSQGTTQRTTKAKLPTTDAKHPDRVLATMHTPRDGAILAEVLAEIGGRYCDTDAGMLKPRKGATSESKIRGARKQDEQSLVNWFCGERRNKWLANDANSLLGALGVRELRVEGFIPGATSSSFGDMWIVVTYKGGHPYLIAVNVKWTAEFKKRADLTSPARLRAMLPTGSETGSLKEAAKLLGKLRVAQNGSHRVDHCGTGLIVLVVVEDNISRAGRMYGLDVTTAPAALCRLNMRGAASPRIQFEPHKLLEHQRTGPMPESYAQAAVQRLNDGTQEIIGIYGSMVDDATEAKAVLTKNTVVRSVRHHSNRTHTSRVRRTGNRAAKQTVTHP